jgi:hypothetical protein
MQLRLITGYLYLAFAALFILGLSLSLLVGIVGSYREPWSPGAVAINFIVAAAAAVAGLLLLKRREHRWLWLAVFVAALGLLRTNLWELFLVGHIGPLGLTPFRYGGPLSSILMSFASHFMLPVMFFLSVVLLFRSEDAAVSTPAPADAGVLPPVVRRLSLFGVLSLVFFGVGIPIVCVTARLRLDGGDEGEAAAALQLVSLLLFLCGFICVMVAFIRWEKRLVLPLLGYLAGVAPLIVLAFHLPGGRSATLIFGVLFCAACVIASVKAGERGRNWSLLAAIPSGFAVLALIGPVLNILAVWLMNSG